MLQSLVQGVSHIEIFSPQNLDSLKHCAVSGSASRVFDRTCKCYVLALYNTASLEVPRLPRESLAILQPFLVLQTLIPRGKTFTVEIAFIDHTNTKRRIIFTHTREVIRNPLHARLPADAFKRDIWVNLCFDVVNFVQECFPGQTYKHLDQIRVTAVCRIRRIFTMKLRLKDTTGEEEDSTYYYDMVPPTCDLPKNLKSVNQFISVQKVVPPEGMKPIYYSNSPPQVNRKYYPSYKPNKSNIFYEDRKVHNKGKSLVPSPMARPAKAGPAYVFQAKKYDLVGKKLMNKQEFDKQNNEEKTGGKEEISLPMIGRQVIPKMETAESVEEALSNHSPSPDSLNRGDTIEEEIDPDTQGKARSLPEFFNNSLKRATEVRHFTPPFVNVVSDGKSIPRFRYDPKSRAYESGLEEVPE